MEKVYMEAPRRNTNTWRSEDVSPYDFRDENPPVQENMNRTIMDDRAQEIRNQNYNVRNQNIRDYDEDEFDMDAIMDEMNQMDDIEYDCYPEPDMYENHNIDWRWNEDVSMGNPKNMTVDKKTVVEEENPKRKTTTWMRIRKEY